MLLSSRYREGIAHMRIEHQLQGKSVQMPFLKFLKLKILGVLIVACPEPSSLSMQMANKYKKRCSTSLVIVK